MHFSFLSTNRPAAPSTADKLGFRFLMSFPFQIHLKFCLEFRITQQLSTCDYLDQQRPYLNLSLSLVHFHFHTLIPLYS